MQIFVSPDEATVRATVGDAVIIALPENPTTGYQWSVSPSGDDVVVASNEYRAPETAAPGAEGQRVVTLHAARAGTTTVGLSLQRVWETAATERREVVIAVQPA